MARYYNKITTQLTKPEADKIVEDMLKFDGFKYVNFKGEMVWKKGSGFLAAPQFIKCEHIGDSVEIQAWLKYPLFPGIYIAEMGLSGFFGFAIKKVLKDRVSKIEFAMATIKSKINV